jgi:hypothetical protein
MVDRMHGTFGLDTAKPPLGLSREAVRLAVFGLTLLVLLLAGFVFVSVLLVAIERGEVGYDAALYLSFPAHWWETGELYYPIQYGPWIPEGTVNLYPPLAMYLFVPLSLAPRVLWWAIPLGIMAWHLNRTRPAWWSWPILAACLVPIGSSAILVYGNTDLWSQAFIALALRWPIASWLLAYKPSVLPIAVLFARDKRWWLGPVILLALALPWGAHWLEYLEVMGNLEGGSLLRSATALPFLAIPLIATWATSRRP